jgi:hypothetical protein
MKLRFRGAPVAVLLLSLYLLSPTAHAGTACESEAAQEYLPPLPRGCQKQRISAAGGMTFGVLQSPERLARKAWEHQVIFFFGERYLDWEKAACKKVFCVQASVAGSRRCHYSAFPCASDADPAALAALNTRQIPPEEVRVPRTAAGRGMEAPPRPSAREAHSAPPQLAPRLEPPAPREAHGIPLPAAPRREPPQLAARQAPGKPNLPALRMKSPQAAAREPYRDQPPAAPRSNETRIATAEARNREPLTAPEIKELQQFLREAGYRVWADGIPGDQTERALSRWQRIRRLPDDARFDRASLEMLRHAYAARGGTDAR